MNPSLTIERKRIDCNTLPKGWQREEVARKSGLSAPKTDVFYYSPTGKKIDCKSQLTRELGDSLDISAFDFQSGKIIKNIPPPSISIHRSSSSNVLKRKFQPSGNTNIIGGGAYGILPTSSSSFSPPNIGSTCSSTMSSTLRHHLEFSRTYRADISLVPPIRQTASIFKQPVTVVRNHENGKVKHDLKHGNQEKPKQLFWEKRLEGLRACNIVGEEFDQIHLPRGIKPIGPNVNEQTVLQSVATALHVSNQPVTGQTAPKASLITNSGAYLNPEQPLMQSISVSEDDIRRQEDRVSTARKCLQEALKV